MMKSRLLPLLLLTLFGRLAAAEPTSDPFQPYLDGRPPEILRELPALDNIPADIEVRRIIFRSRDESEIYAVLAKPKSVGPHPGLLVLHGGGGMAEADKAMAWAQRGYVAIAPDLPGIGEPKKLTESKGKWKELKYGEGRWVATPDGGASVIFDAVLSAMKSLYLLRAQPEVDASRIGVVGISWGGYMTTMVCGLAGSQVRAGFAIFGCGFYELTAQLHSTMAKMSEEERQRWLRDLDAGRRAPGIKAHFFTAGATNDFFFWPRAVQATLDVIPGEKNHVYGPNANHKIPLPGGTIFTSKPAPFQPTQFQAVATPRGSKANWMEMEPIYFDYELKGIGQPLPKVTVEKSDDPLHPRFSVESPRPITKVEVYWAKESAEVMKREWIAVAPAADGDRRYIATLPPEAADWFAVVSDDRPVSVSSDLVHATSGAASK